MPEPPRDPADAAPPSREAPATREQRLAAKLRENLRRRKAQARDLTDEPGALSKPPEKS